MIQLPSKIRTTFFNASVEREPYELFSHEEDRLFVALFCGNQAYAFPAFGRSKQDVLNSDTIQAFVNVPIYLYGPEPLWMGLPHRDSFTTGQLVIVHAIYRA